MDEKQVVETEIEENVKTESLSDIKITCSQRCSNWFRILSFMMINGQGSSIKFAYNSGIKRECKFLSIDPKAFLDKNTRQKFNFPSRIHGKAFRRRWLYVMSRGDTTILIKNRNSRNFSSINFFEL